MHFYACQLSDFCVNDVNDVSSYLIIPVFFSNEKFTQPQGFAPPPHQRITVQSGNSAAHPIRKIFYSCISTQLVSAPKKYDCIET